jgi:hypothetical protein
MHLDQNVARADLGPVDVLGGAETRQRLPVDAGGAGRSAVIAPPARVAATAATLNLSPGP